MKCTILHESRGRLRVHVCNVRMTLHRADVLEAYLNHHDAVSKAKVYERTGDVVVYYTGSRKDAVAALSTYRFDDPELDALVTSADSRRINQEYQEKMYNLVAGRVLRKLFLPAPLNAAYTVFRSIEFLEGRVLPVAPQTGSRGAGCFEHRRFHPAGRFRHRWLRHVPAQRRLPAGGVDPQEEPRRPGPQHGPECR